MGGLALGSLSAAIGAVAATTDAIAAPAAFAIIPCAAASPDVDTVAAVDAGAPYGGRDRNVVPDQAGLGEFRAQPGLSYVQRGRPHRCQHKLLQLVRTGCGWLQQTRRGLLQPFSVE